jgi:glycosyltransferase involved in cell wall biosynthesis
MEFHGDMGSGQTRREGRLIDQIQRRCLKDCLLVTASSPEVAAALESEYGLNDVLALYNVPPLMSELAPRQSGFHLYWRNAVVNVGERGLSDVLAAMSTLPSEIQLHLQGRLPLDGGARLREEIASHGLVDRVTFHPPYRPEDAVREASRFQVGLCLERATNRNHALTVSNKMFDYHMAGLVVVSSDLPGLKQVLARSGGGLCYHAGDVDDLRATILKLFEDPSWLDECSQRARTFALSEGNVEREMKRFVDAVTGRLADQSPELAARLG